MDTKRCGGCGETKPTSEFSRRKKSRDGLQSLCKQCSSNIGKIWHEMNKSYHMEINRAWYHAHKEQVRVQREANKDRRAEYDRKYNKENRERRAENARIYREKNSGRITEYLRIWRENNRRRIVELGRAWRKENPIRAAAQWRNRRARKRNAGGLHNHTDIQKQYDAQKGKCYYCGVKVGDTYHVDHVIPLARGGSNGPENLVIACPRCNTSKGAKLPHEWSQGGRLL